MRRWAVLAILAGAAGAWWLASAAGDDAAVPAGLTGARPPDAIDSIAVLPLQNLSGDPAQDYFADGMTDELITELARIRSLRVISRTSSARYKATAKSVREIGRELDVDAVVEGAALRVGSQARISVKLVEVSTDQTLLAESYTRELTDALLLQNEIARSVAERVRVAVAPADLARPSPRVVPEALDDYLRGRSLWNRRTRESVEQALDYFRRAIDKDPRYALAWAGVADCHVVYSGALLGLSEKQAYPEARKAAMQALAIDETLAEAHASLGVVRSDFDWDWAGAEAEFVRAIELSPSYATARQWYGEFLFFQGRYDESLVQLRRARDLDPLSPVVNTSLGKALLLARRYEEAIAQLQRTLALDPRFSGAHLTLGEVYVQKRMYRPAIAAFLEAASLSPGLTKATASLGHAYAVAGQPARARRILVELESLARRTPVSPYDIALIHTGPGETREAFAWLDRAYEARSWELVQLAVDERLDRLRGDRRFTTLLQRMRLAAGPAPGAEGLKAEG
jgi:TolB-like protein/tetratricopeptide (TPR) repeat protein